MLTDAQRRLIEDNLRIAHIAASIARRTYPPAFWDDAASAANEGLCRAAHDWNPDLDVRGQGFAAYATARCRNAITDEARRHDPLGRWARQRHRDYDRADTELRETLGRPPTPDEIADALPQHDRRDLFRDAAFGVYSLDALIETGDGVASFDLPDDVDVAEVAVANAAATAARAHVAGMKPRLRQVYARVYIDGAQRTSVAAELGVTQGRISQICKQIEKAVAVALTA